MKNLSGLYFPHITRILPTVFDDSVSYLEVLYKVLRKLNEIVDFTNNTEKLFEELQKYVVSELKEYDQKIIDEITRMINQYITDGTIANIINDTLLDEINQAIEQLKIDVRKANYKEFTSTFTISPSKQIYQKGDTLNSVVLKTTINYDENYPITSVTFKKDGLILGTSTVSGGVAQITDGNIITDTTSYTVEIVDEYTTKTQEIKINFVSPILYGASQTTLTNLNKKVTNENIINLTISTTDDYIIIYSEREINSLKHNDINIIGDFTKTSETIILNDISYTMNKYISPYAYTNSDNFIMEV